MLTLPTTTRLETKALHEKFSKKFGIPLLVQTCWKKHAPTGSGGSDPPIEDQMQKTMDTDTSATTKATIQAPLT